MYGNAMLINREDNDEESLTIWLSRWWIIDELLELCNRKVLDCVWVEGNIIRIRYCGSYTVEVITWKTAEQLVVSRLVQTMRKSVESEKENREYDRKRA